MIYSPLARNALIGSLTWQELRHQDGVVLAVEHLYKVDHLYRRWSVILHQACNMPDHSAAAAAESPPPAWRARCWPAGTWRRRACGSACRAAWCRTQSWTRRWRSGISARTETRANTKYTGKQMFCNVKKLCKLISLHYKNILDLHCKFLVIPESRW